MISFIYLFFLANRSANILERTFTSFFASTPSPCPTCVRLKVCIIQRANCGDTANKAGPLFEVKAARNAEKKNKQNNNEQSKHNDLDGTDEVYRFAETYILLL